MAYWRIQAFPYAEPQVLEAVVAAASDLGFGISHVDQAGGHVRLTQARPLGAPEWPLEVAVTDSGLGTTLVRVSWDPPGSLRWLPPSPARKVARLHRLCLAYLRSGKFD